MAKVAEKQVAEEKKRMPSAMQIVKAVVKKGETLKTVGVTPTEACDILIKYIAKQADIVADKKVEKLSDKKANRSDKKDTVDKAKKPTDKTPAKAKADSKKAKTTINKKHKRSDVDTY